MGKADNVAVYMYHHVCGEAGSLAVTAQNFESQLQGLAKAGYRTLGADEFAAFLAGQPVPRKSVVLTFDDGYLDNWVYAHPVLQRYGMKAILFTITGLIGDGPVRPHAGQGEPLPECPPHDIAKVQMYGDNRDAVMLRWDEIHAMVKAGTFEIHSHTHTHTRWDRLCASADEKCERFYEDMLASRDTLVSRLGAASRHLCWPQGYFDDDYQRIASQLGFDHQYTTDARGQNRAGQNPGHIYRLTIRNRPWPWMRQRTWLATHPVAGPLYNRWKAQGVRAVFERA